MRIERLVQEVALEVPGGPLADAEGAPASGIEREEVEAGRPLAAKRVWLHARCHRPLTTKVQT